MKSVKRKGLQSLFLAFVLFFILAFTSSICPTASAHACDCPNGDKYHGTLNGGIYFEYHDCGCDAQTETVTFYDVPDKAKVKFARVYTNIWGGSPSGGGEFNITVNGNLSPTYEACDPCTTGVDCYPTQEQACNATDVPGEVHDYITGCQVHFITYNATPYIATGGTNTVTMKTHGLTTCPSGSSPFDGRIYSIALLVVYEDASMPEITYWINEGPRYMDNGSACCWDGVNFPEVYMYFNGSVYPGSASDLKYWTLADPNGASVNPEFNGKNIDAPYYKKGTNLQRWDNIPVNYLDSSSNLFYYYNPTASYERISSAVLMLNSSGHANLTVTNLSPGGLYADPEETGRYANIINATVANYGKTASFFNLTLYANNEVIDVKRVTDLGEGESRVVSLLWAPNQTGSYTLNVTADIENVVRESDETNNSKTMDVEVTIAQLPEWSNQSSSVPEVPEGGTIELSAQGRADVGLDHAILATNETGTWTNCTDYGSPMDMASYYNYFITHTNDADWNKQTIEREPVYNGQPLLKVSSGNVTLAQVTAGTENLALDDPEGSKPAYASSYFSYPPSKANDGKFGTEWWSGYGAEYFPCWWKVDLGGITDIAKIDIRRSDVAWKYDVLTSNDNETWTTQITKGYGYSETFSNLDWSCRYINITIYEEFGGFYWAMLSEFEAYGPGNYSLNGTLMSSTIETDNPIVSVTPEWNSTEPAGTSISLNVSVDGGATWKTATNGEGLTWGYDVLNNTKLKYKVLLETTDGSQTPVLHDITLNYTTKDPVEGTWLWSNFTWHNSSITDKTVAWKIYYEDMLGQTNCTEVKTFYVGETGGVPNVVVEVNITSFGNVLAGDNTTIYISLILNNSEGTAPATIGAVFKTNAGEIYGLNGTPPNIIPGNNFKLGPDGNETALTNTASPTVISTLPAGATVDYNAILTVPAGQAADDYSGIVELSW